MDISVIVNLRQIHITMVFISQDIERVLVEEVDFSESADDGAPCKYCGVS